MCGGGGGQSGGDVDAYAAYKADPDFMDVANDLGIEDVSKDHEVRMIQRELNFRNERDAIKYDMLYDPVMEGFGFTELSNQEEVDKVREEIRVRRTADADGDGISDIDERRMRAKAPQQHIQAAGAPQAKLYKLPPRPNTPVMPKLGTTPAPELVGNAINSSPIIKKKKTKRGQTQDGAGGTGGLTIDMSSSLGGVNTPSGLSIPR